MKPSQAHSSQPQPQFKYVTNAEDPKLLAQVATKSLESQITLTTRELLAVAPEIRRQLKELVSTKRIPSTFNVAVSEEDLGLQDSPGDTQIVETFLEMMRNAPPAPEGIVAATHMEDLKVVDVEIEGVRIEAILDEGCQIITMRKDVWEKTGLPLKSDHNLTMESANTSTDATLGLLHNVPMILGGIRYIVQIQVTENGSYEMLLGRPFHTHAEILTKHFQNGDAHITIKDPVSSEVVTIPTRSRHKKKRAAVNAFSGF